MRAEKRFIADQLAGDQHNLAQPRHPVAETGIASRVQEILLDRLQGRGDGNPAGCKMSFRVIRIERDGAEPDRAIPAAP